MPSRPVVPPEGPCLLCRRLTAVIAGAVAIAVGVLSPATAQAERRLYVSLGDSYASGYEATGKRAGRNSRNGFAYQLPAAARKRGHDLELVNFACGGATTTSILRAQGCAVRARALGGVAYTSTQVAAAERFLRAHRGRVALITVSIGGNDVARCAVAADPVRCVGAAAARIRRNVTRLSRRLRRAAGPKARIVGITYPDVILGEWLKGDGGKLLASLSTLAFRSVLNPALKDAYAAGRGSFADVTAATGAYGSMEETIQVAGYGVLPKPVAMVCRLTSYCAYGDIHANRAGYRLIANLVARQLPRRR